MMLITINKDNLKTAIRRINKVNKIKNEKSQFRERKQSKWNIIFENLYRQKISGGNQKEAANQKDLNS